MEQPQPDGAREMMARLSLEPGQCGASQCGGWFLFFFSFSFYILLSQWEFLPWEIRVAFPKESQLRQSRATQP